MKDVCEQLHIGCPGKLHQVVLPKAGLVDIMSQTETLNYHMRGYGKSVQMLRSLTLLDFDVLEVTPTPLQRHP